MIYCGFDSTITVVAFLLHWKGETERLFPAVPSTKVGDEDTDTATLTTSAGSRIDFTKHEEFVHYLYTAFRCSFYQTCYGSSS